jgi:tetratricopeptide (TPR) repeat protein
MNGISRWFGVFVLVMGSLVGASSAEAFADRLAELERPLQSVPTNTLLLFQLGDICFHEGADNNPRAVILAESYFKRLLAIDPTHAMARVRYGSVLTMKARDAFWPTAQLSYVKAGNREMDAAVELAPNDVNVRFARAANNVHMPDIMGRTEIVQADLAWLWQQSELSDTELSVGQKQTIALYYGHILQKKGQLNEALQIWRAGLGLAPGSGEAVPLKANLEKFQPRSKRRS